MVELYLIRHGKTYGNTLGRYIGVTDERLCPEGKEELQSLSYPFVEAVYGSPLRRCKETAELIWPDKKMETFDLLRECNFGQFENKNYQELGDCPAYQAWVDSGGTLPFPGGESREEFKKRCLAGFQEVLGKVRKSGFRKVGLVLHGGTIMSILETWSRPHEDFYHWQVKNGCGYRVLWNEEEEGGTWLYEAFYLGPDSGLRPGSHLR